MTLGFLLRGTTAATLTLFAWQVVSNVVLPWHSLTMRAFPDNAGAVQAILAQAPGNGVYFSPQGVLAAVSLTPSLADKTQAIGRMQRRQLLIDLGAALLLCVVTSRLAATRPIEIAATLGLTGLATAAIALGSEWNWYGFSPAYAVVNTADFALNLFLAGWVLGSIKKRLS
jgi:hypothetical protein